MTEIAWVGMISSCVPLVFVRFDSLATGLFAIREGRRSAEPFFFLAILLGPTHFINSVEDIHEALVRAAPRLIQTTRAIEEIAGS